jgi:uncharacterized protein YjbI with pentapeptide repeats
LEGAILSKAHLQRGYLPGAYLEGANLVGAHLEGALANKQTVWPEEFDWRAAGVVVLGKDATNGP